MAIDLSLAHATTTAATRTNTTISRPTGVVDGDFLVAVLYVEDDVSVTPPSGWTQIATVDHPSQPMDITVWWKRAASEPTSWTWTHASSYSQGDAWRVTGVVAAGDPLDGTPTTNTGTGTTATGTGLTTGQANSALALVIGWWDALKAAGTGSWSSPLTERLDTTQMAVGAGIQAGAGASGNKTATIAAAGSDEWMAILFALKEETGGGSVVVDLAGDPATVVATVVDPAVVHGSLSLDVGVAAAVATVVDPAVVHGSVSVDPGAATAVATVVDPAVVLGSTTVDLAAAPATAVAAVVDPTVVIGAAGSVTGTVTLAESTEHTCALVEATEHTCTPAQTAEHTCTLAEAVIV